MKKRTVSFVLLIMTLLCILPAMATAELPADIASGLDPVIASAKWEDPGQDTWFVLTRSQEGVNTLHCFLSQNSGWVESFRTSAAIPQEANRILLHISEGAWDFRDMLNDKGQYLEGPILLILQYSADDASVEQLIGFQRSADGVWNLIALRNYPAPATINVDDDSLTYYEAVDKAQTRIVGRVPCPFDRDLRSFRLADIPLTCPQP